MTNQRVLYEFDDFRIDSGLFLLSKQGQPQPITPTVFRILLLLLENAGRIVTKEELISTVWSDSFVEEGNLNRNVSTLRKALGERPSDHRYIETIPKTGYRFVFPVKRIDYQPATNRIPNSLSPIRRRLTGRTNERQTLLTAYQEMKAGRGGIVCLSGEVGIGKTALVDAFLSELSDRGEAFHLARALCSEPMTEAESYGPFLECLNSLVKVESIARSVRENAPSWQRELGRADTEASASTANGGRMKREMGEFLKETSAVHPMILVLDDFHWADLPTVDLLAFLAARLRSLRVMVLVCMRPAELSIQKHSFLQTRAQLLGLGAMHEIDLPPLTREEIHEFIVAEWPGSPPHEDLAGLVLARSEGNPLFMIEVIRSLKKDLGFAKRQDAVPDSLRNLIRSRVAPMEEMDRALLSAASVQGHEFNSAVLAKSIGMKPGEVEVRLHEICETHGLIRRLREEELMDGKVTVRYRFGHTLYQIVCHSSLPPTRKAALNSAVAEAFLAFYGN